MALNVLSGRANVVKKSQGNTAVRVQDSTAKVAAMMGGGSGASVQKKSGGCQSCGGRR